MSTEETQKTEHRMLPLGSLSEISRSLDPSDDRRRDGRRGGRDWRRGNNRGRNQGRRPYSYFEKDTRFNKEVSAAEKVKNMSEEEKAKVLERAKRFGTYSEVAAAIEMEQKKDERAKRFESEKKEETEETAETEEKEN